MWCGPRTDQQPGEREEIVSAVERRDAIQDPSPLPSARGFAAYLTSLVRGVQSLNRTVFVFWIERPALVRTFAVLLFILIGLVTYVTQKPAAGADAATAGFFDQITNSTGSFGNLMGNSMALAEKIYLSLLFLTLIYNLVNSFIQFNSMRGFVPVIFRTLFVGYLPLVIIKVLHMCFDPGYTVNGLTLAPGVHPGTTVLQDTAAQIAKAIIPSTTLITTLPTTYADSALAFFVAVTKYAIWGQLFSPLNVLIYGGSNLLSHIPVIASIPFAKIGTGYFLFNLTLFAVEMAVGAAVAVCLLLIALEIFLITLEILILLPLTVWTLGFLGAPGTASLGSGIWQLFLKTLIRYVVVFVLGSMAISFVGTAPGAVTPGNIASWGLNPFGPGANTVGHVGQATWIQQLFDLTNWHTATWSTSIPNPLAGGAPIQLGVPVPPNYAPMSAFNTIVGHGLDAILLLLLVVRLPHIASSAFSGSPGLHSGSQVLHSTAGTALGAATGGITGAAYGGGGVGAVAGGLMGAYTGAHQGAVSGVSNLAGTYSSRRNSAQSKAESAAEKAAAEKRHDQTIAALEKKSQLENDPS